ncbi:YncE family protein [Pseudomonas sp. LF19]|uniref:YncE family protein n=1 Tax=Pseudomonas sp. LF19 TaxID=2899115 RepID=UPI001F267817|nr:WD40 repeat domain-containing protein [Pseudomonas sp. LF19]MCE5984866.1 WD40 repeat domain-containing protein [Pseudomonas sp. LF19]
MYIDVPRRLVFFDKSDSIRPACLTQYDPDTGALTHPVGTQADDRVCDISHDGRRMALQGTDWRVVRGASRSRLSFLEDRTALHETDRFLAYWSHLDPNGRYALVGVGNDKKRPVVIDLDSGECSEPIARNVDARFGCIDPVQGKLWAPDERASNSVLTVDCASGEINKITLALDAKVRSLRFSRDGQYLFVTGENNRLLCCDRNGATLWSRDIGEYGQVGAGTILFNESATHLCLPISATQRSNWGEDIILAADSGQIETTVVRHKGPPGRLAADWFGDQLLTHRLEVVDFFSGAVVDVLDLTSPLPSDSPI